jgi:hypothetical protein
MINKVPKIKRFIQNEKTVIIISALVAIILGFYFMPICSKEAFAKIPHRLRVKFLIGLSEIPNPVSVTTHPAFKVVGGILGSIMGFIFYFHFRLS